MSRCYIINVRASSDDLGTTHTPRSDVTIMQQHTVKSVGGKVLKLICGNHHFVTQKHKSGVDRLVVEVSISHTIGHTLRPGLPWTSGQVAEVIANHTQNKHKKRINIPSAESEPSIPAIKLLYT